MTLYLKVMIVIAVLSGLALLAVRLAERDSDAGDTGADAA